MHHQFIPWKLTQDAIGGIRGCRYVPPDSIRNELVHFASAIRDESRSPKGVNAQPCESNGGVTPTNTRRRSQIKRQPHKNQKARK
ncbi:hypothetical protein PUN28_017965 [Cardiocondyla obscurior]|uniref:Uncharacterized protein n=1 Tax=Cardiocondyla obscurior TaxID=286306 RepID=A0AAW2EFA7_9HYME